MSGRVESAEHEEESRGAASTAPWVIWSVVAAVVALAGVGFYGVARDDKNLATMAALGLATLALIGIVSFVFRTLQAVAEPRDEDILTEFAPTESESRKTTALRALKDIDYEHSLGNLSDEDHAELTERYRAEAKQAMRAVDDERKERRERAEVLAQEVLARQTFDDADESDEEEDEENEEREPQKEPADVHTAGEDEQGEGAHADGNPFVARTCAKCSKANDADAKFCKACGAALEVSA